MSKPVVVVCWACPASKSEVWKQNQSVEQI